MTTPDRLRAMDHAVATGDLRKVQLLLRAGVPAEAGDDDPFLITAARLAQPEVFDLLVEHGAPLDQPDLLAWAVDGDGGRGEVSIQIVRRVLREGSPSGEQLAAALRVASATGSEPAVEALLEHGAPVDELDPEFRDSPLANAVLNRHVHIVKRLLAAGANPALPFEELDDDGVPQRTANSMKDLAVRLGFDEIAALLG
jgi:ankyrin repeat protein